MLDKTQATQFPTINRAYNSVFEPKKLSLGLVVPLEAYPTRAEPAMERHIERVRLADELGYSALWLRDVPFNVPSFGDAGQIYDPFVYLGLLSGVTRNIALGVASVVLPLRHPAHVAKAAASADQLSGGRLLLGVASGDRPEEYPAMNMSFEDRGERFRESLDYLRAAALDYPAYSGAHGAMSGTMDMLPKPVAGQIPVLVTGGSQQNPDWVAAHGDGWMTYPRDTVSQSRFVQDYRARAANAGSHYKPVMQSLYFDFVADADAAPQPVHLGFRSGINFLRSYLQELKTLDINHVALNLRFNTFDFEETMKQLAGELLPEFGS